MKLIVKDKETGDTVYLEQDYREFMGFCLTDEGLSSIWENEIIIREACGQSVLLDLECVCDELNRQQQDILRAQKQAIKAYSSMKKLLDARLEHARQVSKIIKEM